MAHQHNWKYDAHSKTIICLFPLCGGVITVNMVVAAGEDKTFDEVYEFNTDTSKGEQNGTERQDRNEQVEESTKRTEVVLTDGGGSEPKTSEEPGRVGEGNVGGSEPSETESTKYCTMCHVIKGSSQFHKRRASADGKQPLCKDCNAARVRASRAKSRGRALEDAANAQLRVDVRSYNTKFGRMESRDSESTEGSD